jgi:hypothetical protein
MKLAYVEQPHRYKQLKGMPWQWCTRCGLVLLNNEPTRWCRRYGCNFDEHPGYKAAMQRLAGRIV